MSGPRVPQFGAWENQSVPYTAYFETARKVRSKGGMMINPNDPTENPDLFSANDSQVQAPTYGTKITLGQASRSRREQNTDPPSPYRQYGESPSHYNAGGRAVGTEPTYPRLGGSQPPPAEAQRRPTRSSAGSESGSERSLHQQAKSPGRGFGAPSSGSRQGNPGISRMKPATSSPNKAAAVPAFGEWNNGSSPGDGYSAVFENLRDVKRSGAVRGIRPTFSPPNNIEQKPTPDESSKGCCIPWRRK